MGAGGVIVILKVVKSALKVGVTPSGRVKLWHALSATHVIAAVLGYWVG